MPLISGNVYYESDFLGKINLTKILVMRIISFSYYLSHKKIYAGICKMFDALRE